MASDDTTQQWHPRMTNLARTFPSLQGAPGVRPWNPEELDRWATSVASHGERVTASFLLAVWTGSEWPGSPFDLMEALRVWDPPHREAFLAWASDPWWP